MSRFEQGVADGPGEPTHNGDGVHISTLLAFVGRCASVCLLRWQVGRLAEP